jgi:hypothetical protein
MSEETLPKYKDPIWQDKSNKHIVCRMLQGNGDYAVAHIVAADGVNPDFDAVLEMYGEEELDRLTAEHKSQQFQIETANKERALADQARHKQEILFNMKLEAFEIEEIKNSQNKDLKKRLRKSKTPIEVNAYATLLIQDALANAE